MGITNELFQTERDETPACQFATVPNDVTNTDATTPLEAVSAIEKFAFFMRFLAPPTPSPDTPGGADSIERGRELFGNIGCALCHTPTLATGNSTVAALRNQPVNLYSDLLVHDMGPGLADGVSQGQAGPREFRTAPLWGLGQRIFFLHDGRTSDLLEAIRAHQSGRLLRRVRSERGDQELQPPQGERRSRTFSTSCGRCSRRGRVLLPLRVRQRPPSCPRRPERPRRGRRGRRRCTGTGSLARSPPASATSRNRRRASPCGSARCR